MSQTSRICNRNPTSKFQVKVHLVQMKVLYTVICKISCSLFKPVYYLIDRPVASVKCDISGIGFNFYRAMHYSAKHGLAIACRLSVRLSIRLSVTLVDCDHI